MKSKSKTREYNAYHTLSLEFKWSHIGKSLQVLMLMLSAVFGVAFGTFLDGQTDVIHAWSIIINYFFVAIAICIAGILPLYVTKLDNQIEDRDRHHIAFLTWFWLFYHHAALSWRAFILIGIQMPKSLIYSTAVLLSLHLALYLLAANTRFRPRFPVVIVGVVDYSLHAVLIILYIIYYQPFFWLGILAEVIHVLSMFLLYLMSYGFIPVRKNAYHYLGLTNALSFLLAGLLAGGLLG
jgi:hypothetical protein